MALNFNTIIRELRAVRIKHKLSLEDVAKRAGWASSAIPNKLESGEGNPTLRSLQRYAEAVGATNFRVTLETPGQPQVLTIFNHAGGVGKTSAVRDIGITLGQMGFKVLLIDADPQASLTYWLGVRDSVSLEETLYPAVIGPVKDLALPAPRQVFGVDLIPSEMSLAKVDLQLPSIVMGLLRLKSALSKLQGYDFVLIDPPPSLGSLSALSSIAAGHLIVPVPTSAKGVQGVRIVLEALEEYRAASPNLGIALFLLTQYDSRTKVDQDSLREVQKRLSTIAPVSTPLAMRPGSYQKAALDGVPLPIGEPKSKAVEEVQLVTTELLESLGVSVNV